MYARFRLLIIFIALRIYLADGGPTTRVEYNTQASYRCNPGMLRLFTDIETNTFKTYTTVPSDLTRYYCPTIRESCCEENLIITIRARFLSNSASFIAVKKKVMLMYILVYRLSFADIENFISGAQHTTKAKFTPNEIGDLRSAVESLRITNYKAKVAEKTFDRISLYYSGLVCQICDGRASQFIFTSHDDNLYLEIDISPLRYFFATLNSLAAIKKDMVEFIRLGLAIQKIGGKQTHANFYTAISDYLAEIEQFSNKTDYCKYVMQQEDDIAKWDDCLKELRNLNFYNSFEFFNDINEVFNSAFLSFVDSVKMTLTVEETEIAQQMSSGVNFYMSGTTIRSIVQDLPYEIIGSRDEGLNLYDNPMGVGIIVMSLVSLVLLLLS